MSGELLDFDYSVIATMSSSHLSFMRRPLTMLKISYKKADGSLGTKLIELNERSMNEVLENMAAIQSTLEKWDAL